MSRKRMASRKKKIAGLVGAVALVGGAAVVMTGTSQASVTCDGLATALSNNQKFIAAQQANPDANSANRIANRQAVIKQIQAQQKAAGCADGGDAAAPPADQGAGGQQQGGGQAAGQGGDQAGGQQAGDQAGGAEGGDQAGAQGGDQAGGAQAGDQAGGQQQGGGQAAGQGGDQAGGQQAGGQQGGGQAGDVVCKGSTVTVSGEGGAPAASSNQFPVGTQLKVTNLDNDKSTTVEVKSVSGSCALLNNAAFEQVREAGKFLIRNARIERVG